MSRNRIAVGISTVIMSSAIYAAPDPQAFDFGAVKFIPTMKLTQSVNSNIYSQPTNEESDSITNFEPVLQFLAEKNTSSLAFTYSGDFGNYWDNSDDNYADHTFSIDAAASPTDLFSFDLGASVGRRHDNRGEGSSEGQNFTSRREPDEYDINDVNVLVGIGRPNAMVGFEFEAGRTDIDYTTNESETRFRDRDESSVAGRIYIQASGKTRVFAEVTSKEFEYETPPLLGSLLDSEQQGFSVGATWDITGKTSGSVKVGSVDKEFDTGGSSDDFTNWDVNIVWSPRTYSHVFLSSSQDARETNGTGAFIEVSNTSVTWQHGWSDRTRSIVSVGVGSSEYAGDTRSDDDSSFSVGLDYDWHRWITVGASITRTDRDSNVAAFDFDRNIFAVSLDMSL